LWLWRGTRYGTSPVMQGLPCGCGEVQDMGHLLSCKDCLVAEERYNIWDISCHAGTAPRNVPSRIYGLQIKKDLT
jgi:hypothetical protein